MTPSSDPRSARTAAEPNTPGGIDRYLAIRRARQERQVATRRRILRWAIGLGVSAFSLALLLPALALRSLTRETKVVTAGDTLVYASGDRSGMPIDAAGIQPGTAVHAFPQGKSDNEQNLIELVHVAEGQASLVAYSAICTHLGCTVQDRLSDQGYIVCPCHASVFDPAHGARVVSGPANRPLPSLPVDVSAEGQVVTVGGFSGPIGPQ